MKQFINGICRICGQDHKDVMKRDELIEFSKLVFGEHQFEYRTGLSDWDSKRGYTPRYNLDQKYYEQVAKYRAKFRDIDVLREQLNLNLSKVERCEREYYKGIGYEWLVTLNFREDLEVDELKIFIEKLLKANYRYLKCGKFVVEYHTEHGNHWHIHIALKSLCGRKKSSIINQLASKFDLANNFVDIRKTFTDPEEYVEGIKTNSKGKYLAQDIQLREELKIKHLYYI